MKDGYYLSAYVHINELFNIHQKSLRHDQNISLWLKAGSKVKLVHYWEIERITGHKQHSIAFATLADFQQFTNHLLNGYDLTLDDIIEVWGVPEYDNETLETLPFSYHSLYHLFSAVMMDSDLFYNRKMIGFALDGFPDYLSHNDLENNFYCACYVENGEIELTPAYSPGLLWQICSKYFHLREGSLMALATASTSTLLYDSYDLLLIQNNYSLKKINEFVSHLAIDVFSLTRNDEGKRLNHFDPNFTEEENKISMCMKVIQNMSLEMVDYNVGLLVETHNIQTNECYLALSGGFSLNCPTNSFLMQKYGFKDLLIPPVVNDGGLSMGIALYHFYNGINRMEFKLESPFYGDEHDTLSVIQEKYADFIEGVTPLNLNTIIDDLVESPIVWFDGRAEIGPRALGHRSILADPRSEQSKNMLNQIKEREWWRPVAPIVLEDHMSDFFENAIPSPYMLRTYKVRRDKRHLIPAVAHIDHTARIQSINVNSQLGNLYQVIQYFCEKTSIPMLCNTSLNDKGEPIINSIEQAMNFALRKGIKAFYCNSNRISLINHANYQKSNVADRMDFPIQGNSEELQKKYNPHDLDDFTVDMYLNFNELYHKYDLTNKMSARMLAIETKLMDNEEKKNKVF